MGLARGWGGGRGSRSGGEAAPCDCSLVHICVILEDPNCDRAGNLGGSWPSVFARTWDLSRSMVAARDFAALLRLFWRLLRRELPSQPQVSIFISYARADDEVFVKRLYADLVKRGFRVWWDRQTMESRGRSFLQEIRDAIASVDRVVLV